MNETEKLVSMSEMYFTFQKIQAILRVVLPVAVAIDLVHSFYYVGVLVRQRLAEIEEEQKRDVLQDVGRYLTKVSLHCQVKDGLFWPEAFAITLAGRMSLSQDTSNALHQHEHVKGAGIMQEPSVSPAAESMKSQSFLSSDPIGALLETLCIETEPLRIMHGEGGGLHDLEQRPLGRVDGMANDEDNASERQQSGAHGVCWGQNASDAAGSMVELQDRKGGVQDCKFSKDERKGMEMNGPMDGHELNGEQQDPFLPQKFRNWMFSLEIPKLSWNMFHPMRSLSAFGSRAQAVVSIASQRILNNLDDSATELSSMLRQWVCFPRIRRVSALRFQIAPLHSSNEPRMSRVAVEQSSREFGSMCTERFDH